jgi:hypothetical protein
MSQGFFLAGLARSRVGGQGPMSPAPHLCLLLQVGGAGVV